MDSKFVKKIPDNPASIKLDIKYVASMMILELSKQSTWRNASKRGCECMEGTLTAPKIPHSDALIVASTDQSAGSGIKGESPYEGVMPDKSSDALPSLRRPYLNLAVIGTRDNDTVLKIGMRNEHYVR